MAKASTARIAPTTTYRRPRRGRAVSGWRRIKLPRFGLYRDERSNPGGRWYIIGKLRAREVHEAYRAREEKPHQVGARSEPAADQTPSVLQLRIRVQLPDSMFIPTAQRSPDKLY